DAASLARLQGKRLLAFAGIGDPARFFRTLRASGLDVVAERSFADHHRFSGGDIEAMLADARRAALTLVTTEKDFARLSDSSTAPAIGQVVPFAVALEFEAAEGLRRFLSERLFKARDKRFRER